MCTQQVDLCAYLHACTCLGRPLGAACGSGCSLATSVGRQDGCGFLDSCEE